MKYYGDLENYEYILTGFFSSIVIIFVSCCIFLISCGIRNCDSEQTKLAKQYEEAEQLRMEEGARKLCNNYYKYDEIVAIKIEGKVFENILQIGCFTRDAMWKELVATKEELLKAVEERK